MGRVLIWGVCGWVETGPVCLRVEAGWVHRQGGSGRGGSAPRQEDVEVTSRRVKVALALATKGVGGGGGIG